MSPIFCKRKSFAENFPLISENMFVVAVRQEEAELWKQMFSVAVRSTSLMNDSSINISCKCVSPCCLTNPVLIGHTLHVMCFLLSQSEIVDYCHLTFVFWHLGANHRQSSSLLGLKLFRPFLYLLSFTCQIEESNRWPLCYKSTLILFVEARERAATIEWKWISDKQIEDASKKWWMSFLHYLF